MIFLTISNLVSPPNFPFKAVGAVVSFVPLARQDVYSEAGVN